MFTYKPLAPAESIVTDFGFADVYGRACGFVATITQVDVVENGDGWYCRPKVDHAGTWFIAHGQPTRSGKVYGASFNDAWFATAQEAQDYVARRAVDCRKRYEKRVRF